MAARFDKFLGRVRDWASKASDISDSGAAGRDILRMATLAEIQYSVSGDRAKLTPPQQAQQAGGATTALLNAAKTALVDPLTGSDISMGGGTSTRLVPEVSIFQAELRTGTTPLTPDNANVTVAFARNFALATLQANGLYADAAGHNAPAFVWVPGANRYMFAGSFAAVGLIYSAGGENRDLSLAAWNKSMMTAVKNAVGIDGVANAASSVTATLAFGTVLFATTAAALARTFQAWVSRKAGYGRVWMTGDGGASWTDITAQVGPAYKRVSIPVTLANPSFGFMLENSGDAINVDSAAGIGSAYPVPYAFLSRTDLQNQSLSYTNAARKPSANPAFSITFSWYYENTPNGSIQLSNAGGYPLLNILQSIGNPPPSVQLLTSAGTLYAGNPTIYTGTRQTGPGQAHKYRIVFAGGTVFSYLDGEFVGIYDTLTPPAALTIANLKDLYVSPQPGNYVSDINISDWFGRIVVGIGDSISTIESYRQGWLKAMPENSVYQMKGVSGNTVAMVRDRITADCALSFPSANACYAVLWCGTNSLANNVPPTTALSEMQTAVNNILALNANVKIILPTTFRLRTGGLTGITAGQFSANADTYNAGLSSLTGVYKVVEMNDANSTVAGFFLADGIHPKGERYSQIVQKLAPWVL